jgi:RNA polymerase sigma-B factor
MPTSVDARRRPLACEMPTLPSGVLLRRYRRDHNAAYRDQLVRRFLPLARRLARRYVSPTVAYDDLMQVASLALLKAIERFDPDRGTSFSSFATPTILGEIKRHYRDCAWPLHVPRSAKENALAVERARDDLSSRAGHPPKVDEIASHLKLDSPTVLNAMQAADAYFTESLDEPRSNDDGSASTLENELGVDDERFELIEDALTIEEALPSLPRREALILRLRFGKEFSQREIGSRLGISQMQVSRLMRRALARLRAVAGADDAATDDAATADAGSDGADQTAHDRRACIRRAPGIE